MASIFCYNWLEKVKKKNQLSPHSLELKLHMCISIYFRIFFDRAKKLKNEKTQNSSKKTHGVGKLLCNLLQKSTEITKKPRGTTKIPKSRMKPSKH